MELRKELIEFQRWLLCDAADSERVIQNVDNYLNWKNSINSASNETRSIQHNECVKEEKIICVSCGKKLPIKEFPGPLMICYDCGE